MNTDKCPTCGAPAKMTWSGLDLVAESGDETLASKHYEYQPNGNNTLLAVSGLPELYKIRNHFVTTLPTGEVTAWNMICWAKDFTRYMDEIIHEAGKAACDGGALDTVAVRGTCEHECTGPWDCQCQDVIDSFYRGVERKSSEGQL